MLLIERYKKTNFILDWICLEWHITVSFSCFKLLPNSLDKMWSLMTYFTLGVFPKLKNMSLLLGKGWRWKGFGPNVSGSSVHQEKHGRRNTNERKFQNFSNFQKIPQSFLYIMFARQVFSKSSGAKQINLAAVCTGIHPTECRRLFDRKDWFTLINYSHLLLLSNINCSFACNRWNAEAQRRRTQNIICISINQLHF